MKRYAVGIDIGTTSVKTLLISSDGSIVDEAKAEHDLLSIYPNWAEEDAAVWWRNVKSTLTQITSRNEALVSQISALGVSGMVPAIVMLDVNGEPVRNTVQQNDARAIEQITRISQAIDQDDLYAKTGSTTNQQHVAPRLLWLKENEPDAYARTDCIMGSYEYIAYKLTGVKSIEINWAVESGMYDIHRNVWLHEQFDVLGLDPGLLPQVNQSMKVMGRVSKTAAEATGLAEGIPVIAGSADHVASTLAAGVVQDGDLLIKFGGAGDILYCSDEIKTSRELYFDYHIVPEKYLLNGCMAASGSLVKWFVKDIMCKEADDDVFKELDRQAALVPPASDGLIVLPYFLGEKTPIFDPTSRGVLFGLTLAHGPGHIFRAILEAVIYGFRHHMDVLEGMALKPRRVSATNGGAKSEFWCQIAADVLGMKITSFKHHQGSALGVAFLAGMSVGMFDGWDRINDFLAHAKVYEPDARNSEIYGRAYRIYRDLYVNLKSYFSGIQKLYE